MLLNHGMYSYEVNSSRRNLDTLHSSFPSGWPM
uniref:Uncharacterized protein n=1 Tax=Arundo donax TaxID=35708 RepID=A0A0A9HHN8_ARUDO